MAQTFLHRLKISSERRNSVPECLLSGVAMESHWSQTAPHSKLQTIEVLHRTTVPLKKYYLHLSSIFTSLSIICLSIYQSIYHLIIYLSSHPFLHLVSIVFYLSTYHLYIQLSACLCTNPLTTRLPNYLAAYLDDFITCQVQH